MVDTLAYHVYTVFYVKPNITKWLNTHEGGGPIFFLFPFSLVFQIQCLTIQTVSIKDHHNSSTSSFQTQRRLTCSAGQLLWGLLTLWRRPI